MTPITSQKLLERIKKSADSFRDNMLPSPQSERPEKIEKEIPVSSPVSQPVMVHGTPETRERTAIPNWGLDIKSIFRNLK